MVVTRRERLLAPELKTVLVRISNSNPEYDTSRSFFKEEEKVNAILGAHAVSSVSPCFIRMRRRKQDFKPHGRRRRREYNSTTTGAKQCD